MTSNQVSKILSALQTAGINAYSVITDMSTVLYNGGNHILKTSNEGFLNLRPIVKAGSMQNFAGNVEAVFADYGDCHEFRTAGSADDINKFVSAVGVTLSDEEYKILLEIDHGNYNLINNDYASKFRYLSDKAYERLTDEEKAAYDAAKAAYEKAQHDYIGQNVAASITF